MEIGGRSSPRWRPTATCSSAGATGISGWSTSWPKSSFASIGIDPRDDPNAARPPVARMRRREAHALGPQQGDDRLRLSRPCGARGNHARAVPRTDARPARPHRVHHAANAASRRLGMERHRPRAARRRFDAHAGGRARCCKNSRGKEPDRQRLGRRSGGPRRGPARRHSARPSRKARRRSSSIRT